LQYIASVTTTHRVSLLDVAGPSTECSSAVASIPVEPSTFSEHDPAGGCLSSQGIDHNEVTFDLPLEELQMQGKETSIRKHTSDFGCEVKTRGVQLMMKSTETQTYKSSFEVILCDQSTQTDENVNERVVISRSPEKEPYEEEITKQIASPNKDPSYAPSKHDELSDDSNNSESEEDSKPVNPQNDLKFVMFKEQLNKLLRRCPECGAVIRKKAYIHPGYSVAHYTEVHQWSCLHLEQPAHDKRDGCWKSFDVLCNSTEWGYLH